MKENMKIEDLKPEQIKTIEELCKKMGLESIDLDEKIAFNYALNKNIFRFAPVQDYEKFPYIAHTGLITTSGIASLIFTFSLSILKKNIELSTKQSTLIQQNQQVIEQNNEIINLLKEIRNK